MANNKVHKMHCSHPDSKDPNKSWQQQIATVFLSPDHYDAMKENGWHISIKPHNNPAASWVIFAPKDFDDDPGDGKGGKW